MHEQFIEHQEMKIKVYNSSSNESKGNKNVKKCFFFFFKKKNILFKIATVFK